MEALREIVGSPEHDERRIARYFSADYQQVVDGQSLDYQGFVQHMQCLKTLTTTMRVSVLASVCEGDTVFTHHHVSVLKRDGKCSDIEVMARFTLSAGLILHCEELTRLIRGSADDQNLGSRR